MATIADAGLVELSQVLLAQAVFGRVVVHEDNAAPTRTRSPSNSGVTTTVASLPSSPRRILPRPTPRQAFMRAGPAATPSRASQSVRRRPRQAQVRDDGGRERGGPWHPRSHSNATSAATDSARTTRTTVPVRAMAGTSRPAGGLA
jgi:hypothetical protein